MDRKTRAVIEALAVESSSGDIVRAICPFCVASGHLTRKKKLDYHRSTGKWECWRCHAWGRLAPSNDPALSSYGGAGPGARTGPPRGGNGPVPMDPPEGFFRLGSPPSVLSLPAHQYARERGITSEAIHRLGFGMTLHKPVYSTDPEERQQDFRGRLIIPLLSPEDPEVWLGYVGRSLPGSLSGSSLPYLYSKGLKRSRLLYREEVLWEESETPALIVEGTLDAAYLYPYGVAVLGTWGPEQLEMLRKSKRPVVPVLDGDAWRKGEALALSLELYGIRSGWVRLPACKDPDEFPREWIMEQAIRSLK